MRWPNYKIEYFYEAGQQLIDMVGLLKKFEYRKIRTFNLRVLIFI